jgi:sterol desaturase/sphingolipid hydroxylase (fatty acid hydroxylase superfamily)
VATYLNEGQGLLSGLSFWPQAIIYFIASDFLLYWVHRLFHGASLWRYHAIHHSSEDVDWTTAYRWHPINIWAGPLLVGVIMLLLGIAPAVVIFFAPIDTVIAVFVHANLNWTLGPLKYVVATPVFHRWHHTLPGEGGQKNFAPTFAFWDVLFGTFYMPEGRMPERYGVDDPEFPRGFFGQLVYPFKTSPRPQATAPAPAASAADRV